MFKYLLIALSLLALSGCGTSKKTSSYSKVDSSWVTMKPVTVYVPGATTPTLNFDSLRNAWIPVPGQPVPASIVNKTYYIRDTSGRAELKYWIDASGQMFADCTAKDQQITTLVEQKNRLIREQDYSKKVVYRLPVWVYVVAGLCLIILLLQVVAHYTGFKKI